MSLLTNGPRSSRGKLNGPYHAQGNDVVWRYGDDPARVRVVVANAPDPRGLAATLNREHERWRIGADAEEGAGPNHVCCRHPFEEERMEGDPRHYYCCQCRNVLLQDPLANGPVEERCECPRGWLPLGSPKIVRQPRARRHG